MSIIIHFNVKFKLGHSVDIGNDYVKIALLYINLIGMKLENNRYAILFIQHMCRLVTKFIPELEQFEIRNTYMELPHGDDFDFSPWPPKKTEDENNPTNQYNDSSSDEGDNENNVSMHVYVASCLSIRTLKSYQPLLKCLKLSFVTQTTKLTRKSTIRNEKS